MSVENPITINQDSNKACSTCQKVSQQLLRCSKCKMVYYCDQNCQKTDWQYHKLLCGKNQNPESSLNKIQSSSQPKNDTKPQQKKENYMQEFGKLEHVGTGNFSMIYRSRSKKDGKIYAIKQIEKEKVKRIRKQADVFMQKHCLSRLKGCDYVVQLYKTFQDDFSLYIQMQYPENGQIWQASKTFGIVSQPLFKYYASHIIKAVSTLHNQYEIVHRDLKPENILLNAKNEIKLIDFGTAKDLTRPDIKGSGNGAKGKKVFEHYVGTPNYMAPQCIHNKASQKASDIYSLFGVLYFLKVGSPPYAGASQYLIFTKSLEKSLLKVHALFDQDLFDLMSRMNEKQMEKRININDVMTHPYFKDVDFNKLLTYQQALQQENYLDKFLTDCCRNLQKKYGEKYKKQAEQRKKIFDEELKKDLNKIVQQFEGTQEQKKALEQRLKVIEIQCECMLNTRDDLNIGFMEIWKQKSQ